MAVNTEGSESHGKVFNDPIHGHFELDPLLMKITDTPQFQRLRHIKQTGAKYYVYLGASHNRFEHSIGVCHLAGEMVEMLREKQPELGITPKEVLCVKIAGLCHDLGHGPFSHVFDGMFIPAAKRRKLKHPAAEIYPDDVDLNWKHEDGSVDMFDHLVKENGLIEEFKKEGLEEDERQFIKELIQPKKVLPELSTWWNDKRFLYEIVANDENGIDVDKWDNFERDCYYLGVRNNFNMRRAMTLARVVEVKSDGQKHICIHKKEGFNLYQMFHTRYCLYKRALKHPVANSVEQMISDALIKAHEGGYKFQFRNETEVSLLEAIHDMKAYTRLTDHVVQDIMRSPDPKLRPAQEILERIERRELYKCVVDKCIVKPSTFFKDRHDIEIVADLEDEIIRSAGSDLKDGDIRVQVVTIDYGQKEKNPIDSVWFYEKESPNEAIKLDKEEISPILPQCFMEKRIRVYSTNKQKDQIIKRCFDEWWSQQNFSEAGTTQAGPPST